MEVSKARIRNGINIESPRSLETWPPCTFGRNGEWEKDRVRERERWMKARPGKSEPSNSGRSFKLCRGFVLKIVRPTFLYPPFIQPTELYIGVSTDLIYPIVVNFIIKYSRYRLIVVKDPLPPPSKETQPAPRCINRVILNYAILLVPVPRRPILTTNLITRLT